MTAKCHHPFDPAGVIQDALGMELHDDEVYRAIFFDWVIGLPPDIPPADAARAMLERHAAAHPGHPLIGLLESAASGAVGAGRRRGGAAARRRR